MRTLPSQFKTRAENDELYIEGYFSVFGSIYELWQGASETIAQGAFSETLGDDIRALIDHESRLVLGRTTAGTLELREDDIGLWGRIKINQNDQDAINLYERVRRGDVNQCSFGFDILNEESEMLENSNVRWTIYKVKLYEVSIVTFPAYTDTFVNARKQDLENIKKNKNKAWRDVMYKKIKGACKNGIKSADA